MNVTRKHLMLGLGVAAALAAPRAARAEAGYSLSKAYTGTATGNSYFDAGYRVEYGLYAGKSGASTTVGASARKNTWVKLFGRQYDATSMRAFHNGSMTSICSSNVGWETYLVGVKIPTLSGSAGGGTWTASSKPLVSRQQALTPTVNVDFVRVGPAVLGFEIKTIATEYMRLNGTLWCNQASAEFRPGAVLTASAAFRADAIIAAAGIRGVVTLMNTSLPVMARAGWSTRTASDFFSGGTFCNWTLSTSATANLEIIPVSGRFEAYVRVGLPCLNFLGLLPGDGFCLSDEFKQTFWSYTPAKKVWPLAGTPAEIRIGDNTASCGPSIPTPPVRS
jgi:hypothetical protein